MIEVVSDNDREFLIEQIRTYLRETRWLKQYFNFKPELFERLKHDLAPNWKYLRIKNDKITSTYYIVENYSYDYLSIFYYRDNYILKRKNFINYLEKFAVLSESELTVFLKELFKKKVIE